MVNDEMITNMQNHRRGMRKKIFFIIPMVIVAVLAVGGIVMALWNCVMPGLIPNVGLLTYPKALGLLLLCKILFSSFRGGRGRWGAKSRMHMAWKEKWMGMSEDEKAKFKQEWKDRCHGRY